MKLHRSKTLIQFLAAAVLFQTVLAGWGYSHCHHHAVVTSGERGGIQDDQRPGHDHRTPQSPDDEDDCALCRYLVNASLVANDESDIASNAVVSDSWTLEPAMISVLAVGLYRPRSPPELS